MLSKTVKGKKVSTIKIRTVVTGGESRKEKSVMGTSRVLAMRDVWIFSLG